MTETSKFVHPQTHVRLSTLKHIFLVALPNTDTINLHTTATSPINAFKGKPQIFTLHLQFQQARTMVSPSRRGICMHLKRNCFSGIEPLLSLIFNNVPTLFSMPGARKRLSHLHQILKWHHADFTNTDFSGKRLQRCVQKVDNTESLSMFL